ncbi:MAG: glyoxalase [Rhodospirillaceae bacterium]|nr:glyoxalase [Rhodospirillaceae bacterium]
MIALYYSTEARGSDAVGKLRHIAVTVPDLEKAAKFYENTFGMERVRANEIGIHLTDGVMNLSILKFRDDQQAGDERGADFHGLHHIGFVVDDMNEASDTIEAEGGRYHMPIPSRPDSLLEVKFRDPNGVVFDVVTEGYATKMWGAKP